MSDPVVTELLPPDTGRGFAAMQALRPRLASQEAFVRRVDEVQRPGGYRLAAVLPAGSEGQALAVAGFRLGDNLAWGRYLYVDDLSTLPQVRGRGYAAALLAWLHAEAARAGCDEVHLDSGVGEARTAAHRLYLHHGYRISSHHFMRRV